MVGTSQEETDIEVRKYGGTEKKVLVSVIIIISLLFT